MAWSATDYFRQFQSLLPWGKAWGRDDSSILSQVLKGMAVELSRIDSRSDDLIRERSTLTALELLNEHEEDLGLPDECTREFTLSTSERRLAARAKLVATGRQDPAYFVEIANKYGFAAEVTEYTPFWCGLGVAGDPCGGQETIFYWKFTVYTDATVIAFLAGLGVAGDSLGKITDLLKTVFCFAQTYGPAHMVLITEIAGPGYDEGFDSGFNSKPSSSMSWLTGGFEKGFSYGFNVHLGGPFDSGFDAGFDKPM
jgi:uncharacterized protein YmfQ (DUF2313 family)